MAGFGNLDSMLNGYQAPSEADRLKLSSGSPNAQAGTPAAQTGPNGLPQPGQAGGGTGFVNTGQLMQANKSAAQGLVQGALDKANAIGANASQFGAGLTTGQYGTNPKAPLLNGVPLTQEMIDNGLSSANAAQRFSAGLGTYGGLGAAIGSSRPLDAAMAQFYMGSQANDMSSKYGGLANMLGGLSPTPTLAPSRPNPNAGPPAMPPQTRQPGFQPVNQPMQQPGPYRPSGYRDPYMKPDAGPRANWKDVYGSEK